MKNKKKYPIIFNKNIKSRNIFNIIIFYLIFLYVFYHYFLRDITQKPICIGFIIIFYIFGLILSFINNYFRSSSNIPKNILIKGENVIFILTKIYYKKYFLKKSNFLFHGNLGRIFFTNKRMIIPTGPLDTFLFNSSYFYNECKIKLTNEKNIYFEEDRMEILTINGEEIYNYLLENNLINQTKS